ncbi:MAG: hypothetical protein CMD05_07490 [Flavobacteriales bacterium]|nr:hypothetical protein [Flavobacteriales bacterium]
MGAFGEIIYLILFNLLSWVLNSNSYAVLISGGFCISLNILMHSRITFRVKLSLLFAMKYILIQSFCLIISSLLSTVFNKNNISNFHIGILTLLIWTIMSYALCRVLLVNNSNNTKYF